MLLTQRTCSCGKGTGATNNTSASVHHLLLLLRVKEASYADVIHPPLSTCLLNGGHSSIKWHSVSKSAICLKTHLHSKMVLLGLNPLKCLTRTTLTCAGLRFAATKVFPCSLTPWFVRIHQVCHKYGSQLLSTLQILPLPTSQFSGKREWLSRYDCEL